MTPTHQLPDLLVAIYEAVALACGLTLVFTCQVIEHLMLTSQRASQDAIAGSFTLIYVLLGAGCALACAALLSRVRRVL